MQLVLAQSGDCHCDLTRDSCWSEATEQLLTRCCQLRKVRKLKTEKQIKEGCLEGGRKRGQPFGALGKCKSQEIGYLPQLQVIPLHSYYIVGLFTQMASKKPTL